MFHFILTSAYIIPNIYVFIRVWQLFIPKGYRLLYTAIYLLIGSVYPLSTFFHDEASGFGGIINLVSGYLLPFYLYFFLSVLLVDILLLINLVFRIIPSEKLRESSIRKYGLAAVVVLAMMVVIAGVINFNTIRISEYSIEVPARGSDLDKLKIAFVSDLHLSESVNTAFVRKLADKLATIKPDILLFGGDVAEGRERDGKMRQFEELLCGIETRYGKFAVLGNHEYYSGNENGNFFDRACIRVLYDSIIKIDESFSLAGRLDSHFQGRKGARELLGSADTSLPLIVLDHRPTDLDNVSKTSADIQFSGHTHNGQMFPINLITGRVYELSWGYKKKLNTHFFVSSGLRLWGPPVRTAGKSEIMVVNVNFIRKPSQK